MIRYFWEGLRLSIQAQLDIRDRDLDSWDEVVDKTIDVETKASLQALSETKEMNFWCPQGQRPTKKDDKDFKNFEKNKSSQNPPANSLSSGTQSSPSQLKKERNSCSRQKEQEPQRQD